MKNLIATVSVIAALTSTASAQSDMDVGAEVTPSIVMTSAGNAVTSSSGAALTTAKFLVTDIATRNDDPK